MKKRDLLASGISENSRKWAKPLDKEPKPKDEEEEEYIPSGKITNEYRSPSTRGKARILRF